MVATFWSRSEGTSNSVHDARDFVHQILRRGHDDRLDARIRHRRDLRRLLDALLGGITAAAKKGRKWIGAAAAKSRRRQTAATAATAAPPRRHGRRK